MLNKLNSKKFVLCLVAVIAISILCGLQSITPAQFVECLTKIVLGYLAVNYIQKKTVAA